MQSGVSRRDEGDVRNSWFAADEPAPGGLGEHAVKDAEYAEDFLLLPLDWARYFLGVSKHELERMAKAWSI